MAEPSQTGLEPETPPRPPSMLDAIIPVVALIGLIALSVYLFGLDATLGPLQVALFTAATIAGLIAHKNGYSYVTLGNAVIGGISSAIDRKSTRLNSSHTVISYAVFCLK